MTRKILLADDSVTIQKVVELTFAEGDYQVQCVSNGKAAVQKIQDERPDILLCDVIMPEMNGYDVATFVKQNPVFSSIPVILLTGTFEPFDEAKARQSGADTYITKPFDSKMLVDKVEELLKRRVAFDSSAHEVVRVFHSRTEFSLGEEATPTPSSIPEASVPLETLPKAYKDAEAEGGTTGSAGEEPFLQQEESVFEPDQTVRMSVPAADLREAIPEGDTVAEAAGGSADKVPHVDIGPAGEDSISDAVFSDILAPEPLSVAATEEDVVLSAEGSHEWPANESGLPSQEATPVSVSGSEDWGAGQTMSQAVDAVLDVPETPEALAEPSAGLPSFAEEAVQQEVVHDLTDQQSMVAEAQEKIDHPMPEAGSSPFAATPPEPITGAYEISAQEPARQDSGELAAQETPFLPDEGLEVSIAEVLPQAPVPPPAAEAAQEPQVPAPPFAAQDTGSYPTPTEQGLDYAAMPHEVMATEVETAPPAAESPESAAAVAPPPALDREEVMTMVREAVAAILPGLVAEALPELARAGLREVFPDLVRQHADEVLPGLLDPLMRQGVSDAVNQRVPGAVDEAVGAELRRALADALPEQVRQVTQDIAPAIISEETRNSVAKEIERVSREVAPEIIRQVAWEVIPELAESLIKRRIQELESEPG